MQCLGWLNSASDTGFTAEEIKKAIRNCMTRPSFDVVHEFCRAMHFEENRRVTPISALDDVRE